MTLTRSSALVSLILGLVVGACTTEPVKYQQPSTRTSSTLSSNAATSAASAAGNSGIDLEQEVKPVVEPFVRRGSGALVGESGQTPSTVNGDIVLNFDATPVDDVVGVIFQEYLGMNYSMDPAVNGTITYRGARGLSQEELLPTLENLLAEVDAALVRDGETYRVVPSATAPAVADTQLLADDVGAAGGFRSIIIPLKYIAATDLAEVINSYGVQATVNRERNLLIVAGTTDQLRQVKRLVDTFDVNWLRGMSFALQPLEHADSKQVAQELRSIFLSDEAGSSGSARVISIDRLNAVLVVSTHPDILDEYRLWIDKLDTVSGQDGQSLYVYRVQHGRAEDLASVLNEIFQPTARRQEAFDSASADDLHYPRMDQSNIPESVLEVSHPGLSGETNGNGNGNGNGNRTQVRVIADKTNNALLILADRQHYAIVESALRRLDVEPLQVLIEASIVEVILGDELRYGLEWLIRGTSEDYTGDALLNFGLGDNPVVGQPPLGAVIPGFSYVLRKAGEVRLALNALAEDARINVLSSPALMVLNNETANIRVGDEVPIATRSSVSNIDPNAPTVNEIEYRDTGVLLSVTPRVNIGGMVSMDIDQEVSNVTETTTSTLDSPTFRQRRITSSVAVDSGETIVLGGLIRERETTQESGIPGLYKIPVLGKLFGTTVKAKERTELIVLITPRAVYQPDDMRAITDEYERKMIGLAPRLLEQLGAEEMPVETDPADSE